MHFPTLLAGLVTAAIGTNAQPDEPPVWDEWVCSSDGGGGHQALLDVHAGFNRVFGEARLDIPSGGCSVANCNDHYFAVCNLASFTKTEVSNARNIAKDADPGNGGSCGLSVFREAYIRYYFGSGNGEFNFGEIDRRTC